MNEKGLAGLALASNLLSLNSVRYYKFQNISIFQHLRPRHCDKKTQRMASIPAARPLQAIIRRARPSCQCANPTSSRRSTRKFSTTSSRREAQYENEPAARPRWSYTPPKMAQPYPVHIKDPEKAWECNSDPAKLDRFYNKFLGRGGDSVLTEEVKWLAITHKSFDQGRRGFNDRLAFMGRL